MTDNAGAYASKECFMKLTKGIFRLGMTALALFFMAGYGGNQLTGVTIPNFTQKPLSSEERRIPAGRSLELCPGEPDFFSPVGGIYHNTPSSR
jgi:hypothetical protein